MKVVLDIHTTVSHLCGARIYDDEFNQIGVIVQELGSTAETFRASDTAAGATARDEQGGA